MLLAYVSCKKKKIKWENEKIINKGKVCLDVLLHLRSTGPEMCSFL